MANGLGYAKRVVRVLQPENNSPHMIWTQQTSETCNEEEMAQLSSSC